MVTKDIKIQLDKGLEVRMVALLVQIASKYESVIYMESEEIKVNAKSIMGMMNLNLTIGEMIKVIVEGSDEESAIIEIEEFLAGKTNNL